MVARKNFTRYAVAALVVILTQSACSIYPQLSELDGTPPLRARTYDAPYKETYFAAVSSASALDARISSRSLEDGEIIMNANDRYIAKASVIRIQDKTLVEFRIDAKYVINSDEWELMHAEEFLNGIADELLRN